MWSHVGLLAARLKAANAYSPLRRSMLENRERTEMTKVEWGQGRVEVIAARDEILAAFADGRSIKSIYAELKAAKRVSLGYDGF